MRRLLLLSLLAAVSFALPSAHADICVSASTHGSVVPNTGTTLTCRVVPYPYALYCMDGSAGLYPHVWVEYDGCVPAV